MKIIFEQFNHFPPPSLQMAGVFLKRKKAVADISLFFFVFVLAKSLGMETEPVPPALKARSLNHWITREVPILFLTLLPVRKQMIQTSKPFIS